MEQDNKNKVKKEKKGRFNFNSYLYSSYLFCFKKVGRSIATFIVMLLSSAMILGVCYGLGLVIVSFEQLASFSNPSTQISTSSYDNISTYGNKIALMNNSLSDTTFLNNDDTFFYDKGNVVNGNNYYLYSSDLSELINPDTNTYYLSYYPTKKHTSSGSGGTPSGEFIEMCTVDTFTNAKFKTGEEGTTLGDDDVIVMYNGTTAYTASDLQYNNGYLYLENLVGSNVLITPSFDLGTSNAGENLDTYKEYLNDIPVGKLKSIYYTPDVSRHTIRPSNGNISPSITLIVSKKMIQKIYDFTYKYLTKTSYGTKVFSDNPLHFSGIDNSNSAYEFPTYGSVMVGTNDEKLEDLSNHYKSVYWEGKTTSETYITSNDGVVLSESNRNQSLYIYGTNYSKYDISLFEPKYVEDVPESDISSGTCYVNNYALEKMWIEKGFEGTLVFSSEADADSYLNNTLASKTGLVSIKEGRVPVNNTYTLIGLKDLDLSYRLYLLQIFLFFIVLILVVSLILRAILGKFYYRKSDDQQVLSYIGYSFKDNIIINLIQFVIIGLVSMAIIYPLFCIFVPNCWKIMLTFPWLMPLSILITLIFIVFVALPTRKRAHLK